MKKKTSKRGKKAQPESQLHVSVASSIKQDRACGSKGRDAANTIK